MIYISTGQYKDMTIDAYLNYFLDNGIKNVELSGGSYDSELTKTLDKYVGKINFSFHNYFPPPKIPFILNLATFNEEIYKLCENHIFNSIRLTSRYNQKYYTSDQNCT